MAWPIPPSITQDMSSHAFLKQFTEALEERNWGAGRCIWPQEAQRWNTVPGVITTISETGMTDTSQSWVGGTDDVTGNAIMDPFSPGAYSFSGVNRDKLPTTWYVVIDDNDLEKVVKLRIGSWTNTGTIVFSDTHRLRDYVTSRQLPYLGSVSATIAALVGKSYRILGYSYAVTSAERVLEWPNVQSFADGTVEDLPPDSTHPLVSPATRRMRTTQFTWAVDQHKNRELLVYGNDGYLQRITITGNTVDTLQYALQTFVPAVGSAWIIVKAGGRAYPGRAKVYPLAFYRGERNGYASHSPDDVLGTALAPATTVKIPTAEFGSCVTDGKPFPAWDQEQLTDRAPAVASPTLDDWSCGRSPERFYAGKDLFKTIHGWQVAAESVCVDYVDSTIGYDGNASITRLNPAETFKLAGLNSYTGTTGNVNGVGGDNGRSDSQIAISGVTLAYTPAQVWYSLHPPGVNVAQYKWGKGTMANSTTLVSSTGTFTQSDSGAVPVFVGDNARTIVISLGFPRILPNEFKRMFDIAGVFIPDVITVGIVQSVKDPPSVDNFGTTQQLGVGQFIFRGKSTKAIAHALDDVTMDTAQGLTWESGPTFITGESYRYNGDNWSDLTVTSGVATVTDGSFFKNVDLTVPFYERYYVGGLKPVNQNKNDALLRGTAAPALSFYNNNRFFIEDTSRTGNGFYDHAWFSGSPHTETGTATSGSTTSFSDSTRADATPSTPTNILNCYWGPPRFQGFTGSYVGFTVEIDLPDGSGGFVTHSRLITSSNATVVSATWTQPLPATASGCVYRIVEPYYLNRFKDRQIKLSRKNPSTGATETITKTVLGNSKTFIFFTTALAWAATDIISYEIVEPVIGAIYNWTGSAFVLKSGTDIARKGVTAPVNFHTNGTENLTYAHKKYGNMIVRDLIGYETFKTLHDFINVLLKARNDTSWSSRAVDTTAETNHRTASGEGVDPLTSTDAQAQAEAIADATAIWGGVTGSHETLNPVTDEQGGAPFAHAAAAVTATTGSCHNYDVSRQYAYGVMTCCSRQAVVVDFYAFSVILGNGSDVVASCPNGNNYSSQGDTVADSVWKNYGSVVSAVRTTARVKCGSSAIPSVTFCNSGTHNDRNDAGYTVIDGTSIVTPAFVYTP